jgi:hypothetical protein
MLQSSDRRTQSTAATQTRTPPVTPVSTRPDPVPSERDTTKPVFSVVEHILLPDLLALVREYIPYTTTADAQSLHAFDVLTLFSDEQRAAYTLALTAPSHVLVTGAGGTGKSRVIRALRGSGANMAVCALTGIAAHNVDGMTIDSLVLQSSRWLASLDFVVVDEVSMCSAQKLSHLLSRGIRRLILFGDFIQLPPILTPDDVLDRRNAHEYRQRRADALRFFHGREPDSGALFAFEHPLFQAPDVHAVVLRRQFRQPDAELRFGLVLEFIRARAGRYHPLLQRFFADRQRAYHALSDDKRNGMVHLYFTKKRVQEHNDRIFRLLEGNDERQYDHTLSWDVHLDRHGNHFVDDPDTAIQQSFASVRRELSDFYDTCYTEYLQLLDQGRHNMLPIGRRQEVLDLIQRYTRARNDTNLSPMAVRLATSRTESTYVMVPPGLLRSFAEAELDRVRDRVLRASGFGICLRVGQRVMATRNDRLSGLYNGMLGTVSRVCPDSVVLDVPGADDAVVVRMMPLRTSVVVQTCLGERVRLVASVRAMPLVGANAMTIHKAQGLSFSEVALFLGRCTTGGLGYVGLSRAVREAGLYIGEEPHAMAVSLEYHCALFDTKVRKVAMDITASKVPPLYSRASETCETCGRFFHRRWKSYRCCRVTASVTVSVALNSTQD